MPGLGSSLVGDLRRLAAAHEAFPGTPPDDPAELLVWHESLRRPGAPNTVSRREALQRGAVLGAGALGASLLGPRSRRAGAQVARETNVVIVGAGLAGLACAYRLARRGVPSTCYEARSRLGGRCWTIRVFENDQTVEHGGQFIDSRHRQIRALAAELDLPLIDTFEQSIPSGDRSLLWIDGAFRERDTVYAGFNRFMSRLKSDYRRIGPYFYDQAGPKGVAFDRVSMTEWLDENIPGGAQSLLGRAISRGATSFFGLEPEDMSAINLLEAYVAPYPGADERYRVAGGNDRIVRRLVQRIPEGTLRLEQPLEALWTRGDDRVGLRIQGETKDVVADVLVLALPFTVLREIDISKLDISERHRRAIYQLAMGTNAKLQLQLNKSMRQLDWTGSFTSDEPEFTTWDSSWGQRALVPKTPILTIWTGGRTGARYPTNTPHGTAPPRIVRSALDDLALGVPGIRNAYNGIAYLDSWVDDPWVRGSYAGFAPGQYTDFWGFLGKREGNVVFAGEHTSTHSQGYLNGGVESGLRAAREVLEVLA